MIIEAEPGTRRSIESSGEYDLLTQALRTDSVGGASIFELLHDVELVPLAALSDGSSTGPVGGGVVSE